VGMRKIIKIDENKCNGCALCIPNCPEGAIQIIDDKARLVSDLFCDGLGACIGYCPKGAITIEERDAQEYDERKVMLNIIKQGKNVIKAHLRHLKEHDQDKYYQQAVEVLKEKGIEVVLDKEIKEVKMPCGCPSAKIIDFRNKEKADSGSQSSCAEAKSRLSHWPIQLMLVPAFAPYLNDSDLLIAADCVPFAYAGFHEALLKGRVLLVGCPKFDDLVLYQEKINQIIKNNTINSITYARMEVPCCAGLTNIIKTAILETGKKVPFNETVISIRGERIP
jgi:ferredoxin